MCMGHHRFHFLVKQELSKITMPVIFNEPLSFLQRLTEYMEHTYLIHKASSFSDSVERMQVCAKQALEGHKSYRLLCHLHPQKHIRRICAKHSSKLGSVIKIRVLGVPSAIPTHSPPPPIIQLEYQHHGKTSVYGWVSYRQSRVDTLFFRQTGGILKESFCSFIYIHQLFPTSWDLISVCSVLFIFPYPKSVVLFRNFKKIKSNLGFESFF